MEMAIFFGAIVLLALLITLPFILSGRKLIDSHVKRWVKEHGYELVKYEQRTFSPFTLSLTKSQCQSVVWVVLKDSEGNQRICWLKLGGFFTGIVNYEVECKWIQ